MILDESMCVLTNKEELQKAFSEWERRYREAPEEFVSEYETATMGLDEYGSQATAYFLSILIYVTTYRPQEGEVLIVPIEVKE